MLTTEEKLKSNQLKDRHTSYLAAAEKTQAMLTQIWENQRRKKMNSTRRDPKLDFSIEDQLGLQLKIEEVTALPPHLIIGNISLVYDILSLILRNTK
jgi:hypothetical protein